MVGEELSLGKRNSFPSIYATVFSLPAANRNRFYNRPEPFSPFGFSRSSFLYCRVMGLCFLWPQQNLTDNLAFKD